MQSNTTTLRDGDRYSLQRVDDDTYDIIGPDNRFDLARFLDRLPEGEWWTEWLGEGDLFVMRLTRRS